MENQEKNTTEIQQKSAIETREIEQKEEQARTTIKKAAFLQFFRKTMGIVDAAAKGAGIDRDTVYIWRKKDQEFALKMDQIRDEEPEIAEEQLKAAIVRGYMPSVHFYLSRKHPAYKQKIEHSGVVLNIYGQLTDEQKLERLRRIITARGGGDGKTKLDLLDGGSASLPENGTDPQGNRGEPEKSGGEQEGHIPATERTPENNGNNDQLHNTATVAEPGLEGADNEREAG